MVAKKKGGGQYKTSVMPQQETKRVRKDKMKPIRNDKDVDRVVSGHLNTGINKVGNKIKDGAKKLISSGSDKLIGAGADKNLVGYASKRIGKGISDMVNQGAGAAKKWIHTEGKDAVKKGAAHVGGKIKEGWGKLKSKFQK